MGWGRKAAMWQKTVAAALVLCGTQGFGYALCQEMQCLLYHDTEQKQLLLYMTREIAFLHRPMQELLEHISEKLQEPYRGLTASVAQEMRKDDGRGLHTIWQEQLEKLRESRYYPIQAINHLAGIGECLGCEEAELQLASLRLQMEELDEEIEKLKCRKEERSRLIQTLSLLTGIFCIVLFW